MSPAVFLQSRNAPKSLAVGGLECGPRLPSWMKGSLLLKGGEEKGTIGVEKKMRGRVGRDSGRERRD